MYIILFITYHKNDKEVTHLEIKARLRKRHDRDIRNAMDRLDLEEGELSDLVREGFRKVLVERGVMETVDDMKVLERRKVE